MSRGRLSVRAFRRAGWVAAAGLVASLVASGAQPLPASAASTSDTYTATLAASTASVGQADSVTLTNTSTGPQSFGSAQLNFGKTIAVTPGSATTSTGDTWTESVVSSSPYVIQVSSPSNSSEVAPGESVTVDFTPTAAGSVTIGTTVKQSNDFNGPNNQFTLSGSAPQLTVVDCTSSSGCTLTSSSTGVTANVQLTTSSTSYSAYFSGASMNCDSQVTGSGTADQLYVDVTGTVTKTVTMTFPKSVVNELPNNGAPLMPVCFGSDYSFPGWSPQYSVYNQGSVTEYEGLLLDCTDSTYLAEKTSDQIAPCVQSRSKLAGGAEQIVIFTPTNDLDYSGYW